MSRKKRNIIIAVAAAALVLLAAIPVSLHILNNRGGAIDSLTGSWTVETIVNSNGDVIACSAEQAETYPDAMRINCTFTAAGGTIAADDDLHVIEPTVEASEGSAGETGSDTTDVTGTYVEESTSPTGTTYEVTLTIGGRECSGVAMTSYKTEEGAEDQKELCLLLLYRGENYTFYASYAAGTGSPAQ